MFVVTPDTIPDFFKTFAIPDDLDMADETIYRIVQVFNAAWEEVRVKKALRNKARERA